MANSSIGVSFAFDPLRFGGTYRIAGTVSRLGVAGKYRVRLYDQRSGIIVREVWSDEAGNYAFNYIADGVYYVVAFDHTNNPVNAAISDYVTPEPM